MQQMTAEQLLAMIGHESKLTTKSDHDDDVVIYSNTNTNSNRNGIRTRTRIDYNTSADNLDASATPLFSASPAQAPLVREDQRIPGDQGDNVITGKIGFNKLDTNARYVEIGIQLGNIRTEGRYMRANIYISLKTDMDKRYSVFLAGAATNCLTELKRGAKEHKTVLSTIETLWDEHPKCMIGRLHYKPMYCKITNFHRKLLKYAMVSIYTNEDDELEATLYLLDNYIKIPLDSELSEKQKKFYAAVGIWRDDLDQFNDDEELA